MTAVKHEESFPRGRSSSSKPALRKVKDRLFSKFKKPKKKTFKSSLFGENQTKGHHKKTSSSGNNELESPHVIRPLTYQVLEEGMVVVGRIREIHPFYMFICLPGKLSSKVPITAISEPYSNSLNRLQKLEITQKECPPLSDLFNIGQAVVCSIVEVKKDKNVLLVNASLDPTLINKDRSHHVIRAGHTLIAAVRTVEDHGYTLHTGISGLTTFLKFGNAAKYVERRNQGRSLVVGEVVRCVVTKCTTGRSSSRAEVTLDPRVMAETIISEGNAQTLHPGTAVSCVVQQSSKAGLVVSIGRSTAYVEAAQLPSCWSSPKYIQPEEELTATVLYSLPNTDFQIIAKPTYLTLKDLNRSAVPKLIVGDVVEAKVISSGRKGLILCLGQRKGKELGNKGFVSIRRLGEIIQKEDIAKKFPKGTVVSTKLLAFDYMEEIYNCTLERDKLEQHYVSVSQAKAGDRVSCKVVEVETSGLRLSLGPVKLYAFKEHSADVPYNDLRQHFTVGDIVDARVLRANSINRQVYVTLKETLIRSPALMSYEAARRGDSYWGTVRKINKHHNSLYVTFYNDVAGVLMLNNTPSSAFKVGQLVKCFVARADPQKKKLTLRLTKPKGRVHVQEAMLTAGELYQVVVSGVDEDFLQVSPCDFDGIDGLIPKCHLHNPDSFAEGDFVKAWLYHKKDDKHFFSPNPSMKYFLKNSSKIKLRYRMTWCVNSIGEKKVSVLTSLPDIPVVEVARQEWPVNEQPQLHQLVRLYVEEYNPEKKILKLTWKKPSKEVKNSDSSKEITKLENKTKLMDKNGKSSETKGKKKEISEKSPTKKQPEVKQDESQNQSMWTVTEKTIETAEKHLKENLPKKKIKANLESSNDTSEMKNALKSKTKNEFKESVQKESNSNKIQPLQNENEHENSESEREDSESEHEDSENDLNTSDFDSDDSIEDVEQSKGLEITSEEGEGVENKKHKKRKHSESENTPKQGIKSNKKTKKLEGSLSDSDIEEETREEIKTVKIQSNKPKPTLSETGFLWDIRPEDLSKPSEDVATDGDEEEDTNTVKKKKKSASERRQVAKEEEERLRQIEKVLLDSENNPQSVDQFDRAVLARPDDDELWIKYISHHLQATEIEKARAVARRALQTINQRLEVERFNVWIALFNLENLFGTQESLKNTLDEALRSNDEFAVYSKMLNIYAKSNKAQEAEQLVHTMLRKFRESFDCWVVSITALMSCGLADKARNLLQRAISHLPPKLHVNLLCKFALLENQHGNSEQSQTLFEHILTTYPKRTDIWNVYVDMLVKSDKLNVARQILERASKQKLPPRKMKMLFNKWISFEEKNGTPEKVEYVRKQALAYVNNITNKLD